MDLEPVFSLTTSTWVTHIWWSSWGNHSATGTGNFRGNLGNGTFSLGHGTVRLSHPRKFVEIDGYSYPYFTHALLIGVNGSVNNWVFHTRCDCWTR